MGPSVKALGHRRPVLAEPDSQFLHFSFGGTHAHLTGAKWMGPSLPGQVQILIWEEMWCSLGIQVDSDPEHSGSEDPSPGTH